MIDYIGLNTDLLVYYAVDFLIALAILGSIRLLSGVVANVSSAEELTEKDNPAFGIAIAGAVVALAIMMTGAMSGEAAKSPSAEILMFLVYGIVGIVLMGLTRILFDRISFPQFSIHDEMLKGNVASSIIDAGNMIATAIMVRAVMIWVDDSSLFGLIAVVVGYGLSQILLVLATIYRTRVFAARHTEGSLHQEIKNGNIALALRFVGYRIGIALAVTAASGIVVYSQDNMWVSILLWGGVAICMFVLLTICCILTRYAVLPGVNVAVEVDDQKNVAIGAIEAAIYLALGLLISGLI